MNLKEQIAQAVKNWDFKKAEFLYRQSCKNSDDLKMDYLLYLRQSGQIKKLLEFDLIFDVESLSAGAYECYILQESLNNVSLSFMLLRFSRIVLGDKSELTKSYYCYKMCEIIFKNDEIFKEFLGIFSDEKWQFLAYLYNFRGLRIPSVYWGLYIAKNMDLRSVKRIEIPRVAVCIYGQLRGNWQEYLQKQIFKYIVNPLKADVFVFSWDEKSEFPSINGGALNWCQRWLENEFNAKYKAPEILANKMELYKKCPHTYGKLGRNFVVPLRQREIDKFKAKNPCVKDFNIENQSYLRLTFSHGEWMYYAIKKSIDLMKDYESQNGFKYDFVFSVRPDIVVTNTEVANKIASFDFLNSMPNNQIIELTREFLGGGSVLGRRECIGVYADIFTSFIFYNHNVENRRNNHLTIHKWLMLNGIDYILKPLLSIYVKVKCVPNFNKELQKDIELLRKNGEISESEEQKLWEFVEALYKYNKPLSKNAKEVFHGRYWCVNDKVNHRAFGIEARVRNSLQYRLGAAMIKNHKNYFKIPFALLATLREYKKEKAAYEAQVKEYPYIQLPPLKSYVDYREYSKIKNHLSYKLGAAVVEANNRGFFGIPGVLGGGQYGYYLRLKES